MNDSTKQQTLKAQYNAFRDYLIYELPEHKAQAALGLLEQSRAAAYEAVMEEPEVVAEVEEPESVIVDPMIGADELETATDAEDSDG